MQASAVAARTAASLKQWPHPWLRNICKPIMMTLRSKVKEEDDDDDDNDTVDVDDEDEDMEESPPRAPAKTCKAAAAAAAAVASPAAPLRYHYHSQHLPSQNRPSLQQ